MKKIAKVMIVTLLSILIFSSAIFAGGRVNVNKEEKYQDAIDQLKKFDNYSDKKLAKLAGMTLEKFKESKKIGKHEVTNEVSPSLFRAQVCPNCHNGRMINHGNKCLEYRNTGETRDCVHKAYGEDLRYERTCQAIARCEACSYLISTQWTESRWDCHGFNS